MVGKLLAAAEEFSGRPVDKAVISVPAYFTDGQARRTGAGEGAGSQHKHSRDGGSAVPCRTMQPRYMRASRCCCCGTTMLPAERKHVPADAMQKEATVTAGRIAGLEAVRIIR